MSQLPNWRGSLVALCGFRGALVMPNVGILTSSTSFWIATGILVGIGMVLLVDLANGIDIRQHFRQPRQRPRRT